MKVLFIAAGGSYYGANRSMLALITDLRKRYDIDVRVAVVGQNFWKVSLENSPLVNTLQENNIPVYCLPYFQWRDIPNYHDGIISDIKLHILNKINLIKIIGEIKDFAPEIIHSNNTAFDLGKRLADYKKIPHIFHLREYGDLDYGMVFKVRNSYVNKVFNASTCIAISESIKKYYRDSIGITNIKRIYNGIDVTKYRPKNKKKKDEIVHFCCVGVISESKNQIEAIRSAKVLLESGVHCFQVHFYGDGGEYEHDLKRLVNENGLAKNVVFHGYSSNIEEELLNMDVGLMLSKNEAFGRVTIEYMLSSMPVIASKGGASTELIQEGKQGYLYELGNEAELADCMKRFCYSKKQIEIMGKFAYSYAVNNFSMQENTDAIYSVYLELYNAG